MTADFHPREYPDTIKPTHTHLNLNLYFVPPSNRTGLPSDPCTHIQTRLCRANPCNQVARLTLKCVASGVFVPLFSILVTLRSPCSHITTSPDPGACSRQTPRKTVLDSPMQVPACSIAARVVNLRSDRWFFARRVAATRPFLSSFHPSFFLFPPPLSRVGRFYFYFFSGASLQPRSTCSYTCKLRSRTATGDMALQQPQVGSGGGSSSSIAAAAGNVDASHTLDRLTRGLARTHQHESVGA